MGYYAIIKTSTNIVENICVWDGDTNVWQPPSGCYAIPAENGALIGFIYNS